MAQKLRKHGKKLEKTSVGCHIDFTILLSMLKVKNEEGLYYPCSINKGADQLRSYCEADLRLCFRLCRLLVFPCGGSYALFE